jgi:hypothetical protein
MKKKVVLLLILMKVGLQLIHQEHTVIPAGEHVVTVLVIGSLVVASMLLVRA